MTLYFRWKEKKAFTIASQKSLIDDVLYESADSYIAEQSLYIQARRAFVNDGAADIENAPDFGDKTDQ